MKNCAERTAGGGIFHEKRRFFLALPQQRKKTPNKACYSSRTVTNVTDEPRFPCRKGLFFPPRRTIFPPSFLTVFFKNSKNNTIFFFACQPFEQNSREIFLKFFCARCAVLPCGILLFCGRAAFSGGGCRRRNNAACPGKTPPTVRWKMRANKPDMKRLLRERSRNKKKKASENSEASDPIVQAV